MINALYCKGLAGHGDEYLAVVVVVVGALPHERHVNACRKILEWLQLL